MAIAPLFVVSMTALKARLRLTGAASTDALAMIDDAVERVRVGFYRRLGKTRIDAILAQIYTDAPATTAELDRTQANLTEVAWIKLILTERMPLAFMDGAAVKFQEAWNEEAPFRHLTLEDAQALIASLRAEVEEGLSLLEGEIDQEEGRAKSALIEALADDEPDLLGGNIWPVLRRGAD